MVYFFAFIILYFLLGFVLWAFASLADYNNGYRAKDWAETLGYFCSFILLGPFILVLDFLENRKNF